MKVIIYGNNNYTIDENGNVYNIISKKFLNPYKCKNGYKMVDLHYNGTRKRFYVHRLVAEYFIPNNNNFPIVMHKDNNKLNCNVNNLKWGSYSENNAQAIYDGLNKIPKSDNRKLYIVTNNHVGIVNNGIKSVINLLEFGNDGQIRNYIFRNSKIPYGKFKGFYIKKFIK